MKFAKMGYYNPECKVLLRDSTFVLLKNNISLELKENGFFRVGKNEESVEVIVVNFYDIATVKSARTSGRRKFPLKSSFSPCSLFPVPCSLLYIGLQETKL